MKKILLALLVAGTFGLANAQEMPAPSPAATNIQRVGLTDVEITYSRPSLKGRTIFGELVPFGEVWRTGANASTKIKFSSEVTIGDTKVKAGTYSFYAIPTATTWTLILNSNLSLWGSDGYSEDEDVVRLDVKPMELGFKMESMTINVQNLTDKGAVIALAWENVVVALPFSVEPEDQIAKNMEKALNDAYRANRNAAEYYADKGEFEKAMMHIDLALEMNSTSWYTQFIKAEILAKSGDMKKAIKQGEMAIEMGDASYEKSGRPFTYKAGLEETMAEWKAKK
jgi:hypothetical protein